MRIVPSDLTIGTMGVAHSETQQDELSLQITGDPIPLPPFAAVHMLQVEA